MIKFPAWLVLAATLAPTTAIAKDVTLLNVSYDPTREFYRDVNAAFATQWKAQHGDNVTYELIRR